MAIRSELSDYDDHADYGDTCIVCGSWANADGSCDDCDERESDAIDDEYWMITVAMADRMELSHLNY